MRTIPRPGTTPSFQATGGETGNRDRRGEITWRYPRPTRDGRVLPNGNVLLTLSRSQDDPGGGVVEVARSGKILFECQGTQSEVNTAQRFDTGTTPVSEVGDKPRQLEADRQGRVVVEVPLKAQIKDHHLQTRMARRLASGNDLVSRLLDKVVREYNSAGEVVCEVPTPDMPFTAIRLLGGNTLIGCTRGNLAIEVDPTGDTVWRLTNDDLPTRPINDACGVQRLPNGNTVVTSHRARGEEVKLLEVTPGQQVDRAYRNGGVPGIHHFPILDTDGKAIEGVPLR